MHRSATIERNTYETQIKLTLQIDGTGQSMIQTGIGFLDHMLISLAKHGLFDLTVQCVGDLHVDCHHTIEDVGIVFGQALKQAIGDKAGITRFGQCILPMDETLMLVSLDLSGRPYFVCDAHFSTEKIGELDTEMIRDFFYAITYEAGMNLHIKQLSGENSHHIAEAMFKAFARALDQATRVDERIQGVLSTKGSL